MMIDALLEAVFTIIVEGFKAAWRHDFPDTPKGPERVDHVEVATQSLPSHPLWDHEIDGQ